MGSFRLAPEWARQAAVILIWPHANSDWKSQLDDIEKTYIQLSRYICRHQKVILVAYNNTHIQHIQETLEKHGIQQDKILIIAIPTNDTWVRDYGPLFVQSEHESKLLNFDFNAWGNKYTHHLDNQFNATFKSTLGLDTQIQDINFVFEAGNLDANSKGVLLSSSMCIDRETKQDNYLATIEQKFEEWFASNQVLWIHDVKLNGDDTDGHIDTLARFCSDDVIAYCASGHRADPNNKALEALFSQLNNFKNGNALTTELIPLPSPEPIFSNGKQLPASYANFLITNQFVLVPVFNDKQDDYALKALDDLFPAHEIIDIESNALITQYGGLHCASMQIPQGLLQ